MQAFDLIAGIVNLDCGFTITGGSSTNANPQYITETANVNLYPNPTLNTVNVYLNDIYKTRIILHDQRGKIILNREYKNTAQVKLNLKNLSPGIYYVMIKNKEVQYSRKLVLE